jgi:hypothetical protein
MMFSGSRDYIDTIDGVDYYIDFTDGTVYCDDGFSMDAVDIETLDADMRIKLLDKE